MLVLTPTMGKLDSIKVVCRDTLKKSCGIFTCCYTYNVFSLLDWLCPHDTEQ